MQRVIYGLETSNLWFGDDKNMVMQRVIYGNTASKIRY